VETKLSRAPEFAADETLLAEAAAGSRAAAGAYLARHLRFLSAMARKLSMRTVDPEDLLADAVTRLLTKWANGTGPAENVNAYLITTMRNIVTDELRSPRSRAVPLEDEAELAAAEDMTVRATELHREFDWVRRALLRLPEDQRLVLTATVIHGRKSGDLTEELGRSAAAVYTLNHRAKQSLRRSVLQVMLDEDAPELCAGASAGLDVVGETPELSTSHGPGLDHIRQCARCRRVWGAFATLSGTFGLVTLLVVGEAISPPPAMAATVPQTPAGPQPVTGEPATPQRAATARGLEGRQASQRLDVSRAAGGVRSVTARLRQVSRPVVVLVAGAVLVLAGAGVAAVGLTQQDGSGWKAVQAAVFGGPRVHGILTEHTTATPTGAILDVNFGVVRHHWSTTSLDLNLPRGTTLITPPLGWACGSNIGAIACTNKTRDATIGSIELSVPAAAVGRRWSLALRVVSDDGTKVTGSASGHLPARL
jgi:RNA polymerase sigma factor (sigma-70 family)